MKWGIRMKRITKVNNKGYSLIEIIIVVAIVAIVSSAGTASLNLIHNSKVSTAARTVNSYCKSVRLNNMTKKELKYIHVFKKNNSNYVYVDSNKSANLTKTEKEIGNTNLAIYYGSTSGSKSAITNDNVITITFDRSGQCQLLNKSGSIISTVDLLSFTNGKRSSDIIISKLTGKVTME